MIRYLIKHGDDETKLTVLYAQKPSENTILYIINNSSSEVRQSVYNYLQSSITAKLFTALYYNSLLNNDKKLAERMKIDHPDVVLALNKKLTEKERTRNRRYW